MIACFKFILFRFRSYGIRFAFYFLISFTSLPTKIRSECLICNSKAKFNLHILTPFINIYTEKLVVDDFLYLNICEA